MKYRDFERIISAERMTRYVQACGGDTRKAMTLYRYNIELSQVMFAIISHFEVALRNAIDSILAARFGNEWLKDSAQPGGLFDTPDTLRNRITHHEPICFPSQGAAIYTEYILNEYHKIMTLFQWMGINSSDLLYGLYHVQLVCKKMEKLGETWKNNTHRFDLRQGLMGFLLQR